ncbi:MAG: WD40/YVTN/BNR-like repeat-containing protein, partial [Terriglobales bacterium]
MAAAAAGQTVNPSFYAGMRWRLVGPFRAGRISAVEGIAGNPAVYYIGNPGGGVDKSTSGGEVWTPIFDATGQDSIGAIAVAPSDPKILYVGTGDVDNVGGSVNQGDGVWKSTDAGAHWRHLGLDDSHHISAIVVDPHNPDLVLVAALGHTYAANPMRGIYRSTDGGTTWQQVLYKGPEVGAI